jgi:hypothetical protein
VDCSRSRTVIKARRHGLSAGWPRVGNQGANRRSSKIVPISSRRRTYKLPLGKAARATCWVSSGTGGNLSWLERHGDPPQVKDGDDSNVYQRHQRRTRPLSPLQMRFDPESNSPAVSYPDQTRTQRGLRIGTFHRGALRGARLVRPPVGQFWPTPWVFSCPAGLSSSQSPFPVFRPVPAGSKTTHPRPLQR